MRVVINQLAYAVAVLACGTVGAQAADMATRPCKSSGDREPRLQLDVEGLVSGNWTAKLEYLYIDLGSISGAFVTPSVAPGGAFVTSRYTSHMTDNILRVGLNYKWGGPVVAAY
jgi:hypothetical protein